MMTFGHWARSESMRRTIGIHLPATEMQLSRRYFLRVGAAALGTAMTPLHANADALLRMVKQQTGNSRIYTLINTHWHPDQTGANEAVGREGGIIFAHEKTRLYESNTVTSVTFQGRLAPLPQQARPNKTIQGDGSL